MLIPVRREINQLDNFAKLGQVLRGILNFLRPIANGIGLLGYLEDGITSSALMEAVVNLGHLWRL